MNHIQTSAGLVVEELKPVLGDRLVTSNAVREHHSHDSSWLAPHMPDAVAFPRDEDEVVAIVSACAKHGVPVVPFGAGSSMEGHTIPLRGGITIDTREMNQIVEIRPEDGLAGFEAKRDDVRLLDYYSLHGIEFALERFGLLGQLLFCCCCFCFCFLLFFSGGT